MVIIRGLSRALGRVIGRALGKEVNIDLDEAPQRQRPTTSACRQREAAPVAEDVQHLDHAVDKVHEHVEEAVVDDVVPDAEGFPNRPHDTSVLIGYVHHVAVTVWNEDVFIFLNNIFISICYYC